MAEAVEAYIVQLVIATREPGAYDNELSDWLEFGASPRATIAQVVVGVSKSRKALCLRYPKDMGPAMTKTSLVSSSQATRKPQNHRSLCLITPAKSREVALGLGFS